MVPGLGRERFTSEEKELIRLKHDDFELWLAEATGGSLRAKTDILELPGPLTTLSLGRRDASTQPVDELAYWVGPGDVAPLVGGRFFQPAATR